MLKVRRLAGVWCHENPIWCLQLLHAAASQLKELEVVHVRQMHLSALHRMPMLERLHVWGDDDVDEEPAVPLPLAAHQRRRGPHWLRVRLPRRSVEAVLKAHGRGLKELHLVVGTRGGVSVEPSS